MKKTRILLSALFISLIFTGCFSPVYYEIRKDVKPEQSTIFGNIPEITRFTAKNDTDSKEFLFLNGNGKIMYKPVDSCQHGEWTTFSNEPCNFIKYNYISSNFDGEQLVRILSDETTLYAITVVYSFDNEVGKNNPKKMKLYGTNIKLGSDGKLDETNEWKTIIDDDAHVFFNFVKDSNDYTWGRFSVFQTNSPKTENRKVYIRSGENKETCKYYELKGLSEPLEITSSVSLVDSADNVANSAVYFEGETLFFNSLASTTNETYVAGDEGKATRFYYGNGKELWCNTTPGSKETKKALDAEAKISSLATCSDSILIGRGDYSATSNSTGGIKKATLSENGEPGTVLASFDTNAGFQLSTAYLINSVLNATPEKSEKESILYSSISIIGTGTSSGASFKNVGLWSYYPTRGNWNRE